MKQLHHVTPDESGGPGHQNPLAAQLIRQIAKLTRRIGVSTLENTHSSTDFIGLGSGLT